MSHIGKDRSDATSFRSFRSFRSDDVQSVMSVRTKAAKREKWSSEFYFIAVLVNYTLNLQLARRGPSWVLKSSMKTANILIFPALLVLIGTPIIFMQLTLGQYSGRTTISVWDLCPAFRGVGIASFFNFMFYQVYNLMWCGYCLFYTFVPFMEENNWDTCNESWTGINCYTSDTNISQWVHCYKVLGYAECSNMTWYTSTEMFWLFHVLNYDRETWRFGTLNYKLMPFGFATSVLTYLANFSGVRTVESSLSWLFFIPFAMMAIVLFNAGLHPGAFQAFKDVKETSFTDLGQADWWALSISAMIYLSSIGFGNNIVFGAQCTFRMPLHFKAYLTIVGEGMFVFMSSIMTMMMAGIIDYDYNEEVWTLLNSKETIMFTVLPDAVTRLPNGSKGFWVCFFYAQMFLFGYRAQVMMVCNTLDIFYDMRPKLKRHHHRMIFCWCIGTFLASIVLYCRIGHHYMHLMERFIFMNTMAIILAAQVFAVAYVYGVGRFCDDASFMLGMRVPTYFRISYYVLPFVFLGVFVVRTRDFYLDPKDRFHVLPDHVWHASNFLVWSGVVFIFGYFAYYSVKHYIFKKGKNPFVPTVDWGPSVKGLEKSRQMFSAHSMTKEYIYRQERFKKHNVSSS